MRIMKIMQGHTYLAVFVAMVVMSSCSDGSPLDPSDTDGMHAIVVSSNTRAGSGEYNFDSNDNIWFWANKTDNTSYIKAWKLTAGSSGETSGDTHYWPYDGGNLNAYALYGNFGSSISENTTVYSTTTITHTVLTDQTSDANRKTSDLLYASQQNCAHPSAISLTFSHLLTKVSVVIDLSKSEGFSAYDLSNAEVKINNVYTSATVSLANGTATASGTKQDITIAKFTQQPSGTSISAGSAIIPVQALGGSTLITVVSKVNSKERSFTFAPTTSFTPNKDYEYTYTISIKNGKISMSGITVGGFTPKSSNVQLPYYVQQ